MTTPFDSVIEQIKVRGFHNHRLEDHSDILSRGILEDLQKHCDPIGADFAKGQIGSWLNVRTPGDRNRKIDLLAGEPLASGEPDLTKLRLCVENKSVVTAHRNRTTRLDDLDLALQALHHAKAKAVLVATIIIGVAQRVLNVPDGIKKRYKKRLSEFARIVPRLSSGDQSLWEEFDFAISMNRPNDPAVTLTKLRQLRIRPPGYTHVIGYDYVMLVPAFINNVDPPYIPNGDDPLSLGINVQHDYEAMLDIVCKAYTARWHF
jgi:hypothetical protein